MSGDGIQVAPEASGCGAESTPCRRTVSVPRTRRMRAVAIVAALVLAAPAVDAVLRAAPPPGGDARGSPVAGLDANALAGAGGPEAFLDRLEALADAGAQTSGAANGASVPGAFAREIGFLDGARDVRVSEGGAVVGYLVEGDAEEVLERLNCNMEALGWTCVPLGEQWGSTYVKGGGACTWALASCTQVGTATSVVVRCVAS